MHNSFFYKYEKSKVLEHLHLAAKSIRDKYKLCACKRKYLPSSKYKTSNFTPVKLLNFNTINGTAGSKYESPCRNFPLSHFNKSAVNPTNQSHVSSRQSQISQSQISQSQINIHQSFVNTGVFLFLALVSGVTSINTNVSLASAHKIKIDAQVGATLHIEPNDNPRAGESAKTWFALTRKGGKVIPLSECDCKLKVYKEPLKTESSPILQPPLRAVSAEKYKGIPGTNIVFPSPGAYQLKLSGSAATAGSFQSFELEFPVTVAAGKKVVKNTDELEVITKDTKTIAGTETAETKTTKAFTFPVWAIGLSAIAVLGGLFIVLGGMKR